MADADGTSIAAKSGDHVREGGKPLTRAVGDRDILVHDVQHEIARAAADRDGPDVEGAFGVLDRLARDRPCAEDCAGCGLANRLDDRASAARLGRYDRIA